MYRIALTLLYFLVIFLSHPLVSRAYDFALCDDLGILHTADEEEATTYKLSQTIARNSHTLLEVGLSEQAWTTRWTEHLSVKLKYETAIVTKATVSVPANEKLFTSTTTDMPCNVTLDEGIYFEHHGWYNGNFGHVLHDHLPSIALIRTIMQQLPPTAKLVLLANAFQESLMLQLDPEFYKRMIWVKPEVTVCLSGKVYLRNQAIFREQNATAVLKIWLDETFAHIPTTPPVTVYYTRTSKDTHHGRTMDADQEAQMLGLLEDSAAKRGEPLIIFDGTQVDENGTVSTMSVLDQVKLFRRARLLVGPHGSGMANMLWMHPGLSCDTRPQVLEFTGGRLSSQAVQKTKPYNKTYWNLLATPAWAVYRHIVFGPESSSKVTYVNIDEFKCALDAIDARLMNTHLDTDGERCKI